MIPPGPKEMHDRRGDGEEAFAEIRKMDGEIPVVIVTGLKVGRNIGQMSEQRNVKFLAKPYQIKDLELAISDLISEPTASTQTKKSEPLGSG